MGILEVGHEYFGAGVQRVDGHFALDRAGNFDAPVLQIVRNGGNCPTALAYALGFGEEVGHLAGVNFGLALHPALQEFLAPARKRSHQFCDESHCLWRQYLGKFSSNGTSNLDALLITGLCGHRRSVPFHLCQREEGQVLSHLLDMITPALLLLKINEIVLLRLSLRGP